jgi:hypothetical protein
MDFKKGWLAQLFILGLHDWAEICVDYERYLIRCHFCTRLNHLIKNCPPIIDKKDWVASLNSKGKLLGETLTPNLEVDKVNEKTIEEMRLRLSPNPR